MGSSRVPKGEHDVEVAPHVPPSTPSVPSVFSSPSRSPSQDRDAEQRAGRVHRGHGAQRPRKVLGRHVDSGPVRAPAAAAAREVVDLVGAPPRRGRQHLEPLEPAADAAADALGRGFEAARGVNRERQRRGEGQDAVGEDAEAGARRNAPAGGGGGGSRVVRSGGRSRRRTGARGQVDVEARHERRVPLGNESVDVARVQRLRDRDLDRGEQRRGIRSAGEISAAAPRLDRKVGLPSQVGPCPSGPRARPQRQLQVHTLGGQGRGPSQPAPELGPLELERYQVAVPRDDAARGEDRRLSFVWWF